MRFSGGEELRANVRRVAAIWPDRAGRALEYEAEIDATEMKRRTPVDTTPDAPHPGQLRASIHVLPFERSGDRISVTTATTSQVSLYDIYVHEDPDALHPVGQWKFMESVVNESRPFMLGRVGRRLQLSKVL